MNIEQKPLEYEFNHLFGVNSSPFLAQFVSRHHAKTHPRAEVIFKINLYG